MSDLGWRAEGIARAVAAGGVVLEKYHRPGFGGGTAVRRAHEPGGIAEGFGLYYDPEPYDYEMRKRRGRNTA